MLGVNLMSRTEEVRAFTAANLAALKYFTVDSNILVALVAIIYLCYEIALAKGKIKALPKMLHLVRLAAATGVALTMLVTACFLIPQFGSHWYILYIDNNFFFHLTVPLLSVIAFIFFEDTTQDQNQHKKLSLKDSIFGITPMALYAVFYTINVFVHLGNGEPLKTYDWYNFLNGKVLNALIAIPSMLIVTWGISLALWAGNRKVVGKNKS